jgi:hypothetical protein
MMKANSQAVVLTKELIEVSKEVNTIANKAIQEVHKITYHVEALQVNLQTMLSIHNTRIEKIEAAIK